MPAALILLARPSTTQATGASAARLGSAPGEIKKSELVVEIILPKRWSSRIVQLENNEGVARVALSQVWPTRARTLARANISHYRKSFLISFHWASCVCESARPVNGDFFAL